MGIPISAIIVMAVSVIWVEDELKIVRLNASFTVDRARLGYIVVPTIPQRPINASDDDIKAFLSNPFFDHMYTPESAPTVTMAAIQTGNLERVCGR